MKSLWKNLKFAWQYTKNEKTRFILFFICIVFHVIISIVIPILGARLIVSLTSNTLTQVLFVAMLIFMVEISRNIFIYLCNYFSQVIYRESFTRIQLDLGKSILKLTNSCIDDNSSGVFIERLTNDTSKIADVFNLINFELSTIITNIGIFGALLIIDLRIFLYILIMTIIIGIAVHKKEVLKNKKDKEFRKENENVSGFVGELVRGVRDIKMLNAEKSFIKEFNAKLIHLNQTRYSKGKVNREYSFLIGFLQDFFDFSVITLIVYLLVKQELTVAVAIIVYNYSRNITYIVDSYSYLLEGLKDFNLSTTRIFEIINSEKYPKEEFGNISKKDIYGNFEFNNINFSYNEDFPVLSNLSFKVDAYKTVAFVGKSGSGKSTIFNLLCKMYNPDSGTITIDGINIQELDKDSIRGNITIINQNPYIFNLSIKDNLRLVKENLTEEEMVEACRIACLEEFINDLPNGYDTIVGEGGINLSGGQRQRLAIARALVQKSKIILFDEATSALDNVTQTKIQQAIENLQGNYTILIIAHRLSTIVNSDYILFLENGHIKAKGTHEELLNNSPNYKKLYQTEIEQQ